MTGPEHYRTAEQLLDQVIRKGTTGPIVAEGTDVPDIIAAAQAHATLALAASNLDALETVRQAGMQQVGRPPRTNSPEELAEVAAVYREHVDTSPVLAVQQVMGYRSHRTAARRVEKAREAGLLPATSQGRKNGGDPE